MDKSIFDENNGLWYEQQGDYFIPCLTLPTEKETVIGVGGRGICGISKNTRE